MNSEYLMKEEEGNLTENLELINKEIENNNEIIKGYVRGDINNYKRTDESNYSKAIEKNNDYKSMKVSPYHGRLTFEDEDGVSDIYIGMKDLIVDNEPYIVSWAAPIADVYQRFNGGDYEYDYQDKSGRTLKLSGKIRDKRKMRIENSKLKSVYQYTNVMHEDEEKIKEEVVSEKFKNVSTEKLGSIVDSIDVVQNEIVRLPIERNVLVQGCAGSGKSSVAFHRLAYLAYNYELEKNDLLVISPNKVFKDYTKDIMFELGGDFEINQYTMKEFVKEHLGEVTYKKESNAKLSMLKSSKNFKTLLDKYMEYVIDNYVSTESVTIDGFEIINSDDIKYIWKNTFSMYKLNDRVEKFKSYLDRTLRSKVATYLENEKEIHKKDLEIAERYKNNPIIFNEIKKLMQEEWIVREKRLKKLFALVINEYINKYKVTSPLELYIKLFRNSKLLSELSEGLFIAEDLEVLRDLDNNLYESDLIPIFYIMTLTDDLDTKLRHIVVDECQELSYIEISIIESLTKSFTFVGDFNQSINIYKHSTSLEEIKKIFNKYTYFDIYYLNKSFRNSNQITNYSNEILKDYFINKDSIPMAFNRNTIKPSIYVNNNEEKSIEDIINNVNEKYSEFKNIAIILKSEAAACEVYKKLSAKINSFEINLISDENCSYIKGVNVLPASLSMGLEFDYVMIADAMNYKDTEFDRRLLYIACTRALHELHLYTDDRECIACKVQKELWSEFVRCSTKSIDEGMKGVVLKCLNENFGIVRDEYKEFIEQADITKLIELTQKIYSIRSIEELFENEDILIEEDSIEEDEIVSLEITTGEVKEESKVEKFREMLIKTSEGYPEKQKEIVDFIVNHTFDILKFDTIKAFAQHMNVSTGTINVLLLKLNLGTYGKFYRRVYKLSKSVKN